MTSLLQCTKDAHAMHRWQVEHVRHAGDLSSSLWLKPKEGPGVSVNADSLLIPTFTMAELDARGAFAAALAVFALGSPLDTAVISLFGLAIPVNGMDEVDLKGVSRVLWSVGRDADNNRACICSMLGAEDGRLKLLGEPKEIERSMAIANLPFDRLFFDDDDEGRSSFTARLESLPGGLDKAHSTSREILERYKSVGFAGGVN